VQNAVWISHGHRANLEPFIAYSEFIALCQFVRHERNSGGFKFGHTHADSNKPVVVDAGLDRAGRAVQKERLRVATFIRENGRHAPHAVATLLNLRAVGVEDPVTGRKGGIVGVIHPHELVKTRSGGLVSELSKLLRRRWRHAGIASIDDKNLVSCAVHFCVSDFHGLFRLASVVYINLKSIELESMKLKSIKR